eukprot:9425954-Alexandrium_andersonii.AAC.1
MGGLFASSRPPSLLAHPGALRRAWAVFKCRASRRGSAADCFGGSPAGVGGLSAFLWPSPFLARPGASRRAWAVFKTRAFPYGLGGCLCRAASNGLG